MRRSPHEPTGPDPARLFKKRIVPARGASGNEFGLVAVAPRLPGSSSTRGDARDRAVPRYRRPRRGRCLYRWPSPSLWLVTLLRRPSVAGPPASGSACSSWSPSPPTRATAARRSTAVSTLEIAAVFTVFFLFLVAIRVGRPSHPAHRRRKVPRLRPAEVRSCEPTASHPEDMWFAGEPVAYYYGGHLVAAILTKITVGLRVTTPTTSRWRATQRLVTAVYGLAGPRRRRPWNLPAVPQALSGAFFVGVASNLSTPVKFLVWQRLLRWPLQTETHGRAGSPIEGFSPTAVPQPLAAGTPTGSSRTTSPTAAASGITPPSLI